jgi:two-component system cell cycle sensor histidine kinase/response regulator CckA
MLEAMSMWRKQIDDDGILAVRREPAQNAAAVLVVDDDYQVRQVIREVLEEGGYTVLVARDANDALAVLEAAENAIDLAVVDFNLPGIDGRHLATRINAVSPATRILYVSGQPRDTLSDYGLIQDSWFLEKPFTHAQLLSRAAERLQN